MRLRKLTPELRPLAAAQCLTLVASVFAYPSRRRHPPIRWRAQRARLSNHFFALGRRCGQPGQQQGLRFPAWRSSIARWIRRLRVVSCLAEITQQTHSFRASGVKSFHADCVLASELSALRKSVGALCSGPSLFVVLSLIASSTP
jgi:hypothetical protein